MKVAVIGSGYVGLVLGACLAESGNDVVSADIDEGKVARLNAGQVPLSLLVVGLLWGVRRRRRA